MTHARKQEFSSSISRNTLQIIAIVTMLIDHLNTAINPFVILYCYYRVDMKVAYNISGLLEGIGRAAFLLHSILCAAFTRKTL